MWDILISSIVFGISLGFAAKDDEGFAWWKPLVLTAGLFLISWGLGDLAGKGSRALAGQVDRRQLCPLGLHSGDGSQVVQCNLGSRNYLRIRLRRDRELDASWLALLRRVARLNSWLEPPLKESVAIPWTLSGMDGCD